MKTSPLFPVTLGTVIHATSLPEDLIPAFTAELDAIASQALADDSIRETIREGKAWTPEASPEDTDGLLEELFDALDSIAPSGTYFGAHEGNGSDFGFWQCGPEA